MASLAELMFKEASQNIRDSKLDPSAITKAFQGGAQLAQKRQQIEQQGQQIKNAKEQAGFHQLKFVTNNIKDGLTKVPKKARRSFFKNVVRPQAEKAGMKMDDAFIDSILSDDVDTDMLVQDIIGFDSALRKGDTGAARDFAPNVLEAMNGDATKFAKYTSSIRNAEAMGKAREVKETRLAEQFSTGQENLATRRFTDFVGKVSTDVESRFRKIDEQKAGVRLAHKELGGIMADFKDGKVPSILSFNAASRGMAKAFNSGAMTDRDVADFRNITGIENITIDAMNKWLTGSVNQNSATQLLSLSKRIATNLDATAEREAKALTPRFTTPEFEGRAEEIRKGSGLAAKLIPTLDVEDAVKSPVTPESSGEAVDQVLDMLMKGANTKDLSGDLLLEYINTKLEIPDGIKQKIIQKIQLKDKPGAK